MTAIGEAEYVLAPHPWLEQEFRLRTPGRRRMSSKPLRGSRAAARVWLSAAARSQGHWSPGISLSAATPTPPRCPARPQTMAGCQTLAPRHGGVGKSRTIRGGDESTSTAGQAARSRPTPKMTAPSKSVTSFTSRMSGRPGRYGSGCA
jgi:hypothetical protein